MLSSARILFAALFAQSLSGCSEMGRSDKETLDSDASEADSDGDEGDVDTAPDAAPPAFYALDGTLVLEDGAVSTTTTALTVSLWTEDGTALCEGDLLVTSATDAVLDDPDLAMYGWWTLALEQAPLDTGEEPCAGPYPTNLNLGIGQHDARLDAAASAAALPGDKLNGLYIQPSSADVFVYGVAGTEEQYAGASGPIDAGPLPDGSYRLEALHLLPL